MTSLLRLSFTLQTAFVSLAVLFAASIPVHAQNTAPLRLDVAGAAFAPLPVAVAPFLAEDSALEEQALDMTGVVRNNLERSGLFTIVPEVAYISPITDFDVAPSFANWRAIGVDALVTGAVFESENRRLQVRFRVFDTNAEEQIDGFQFISDPENWRRMAHKVSDIVYTGLTGEGGYFDSRILFVEEQGPKGDRFKRLAIMDQDGANLRYLEGASGLVLTPRFSPDEQTVLYISYDTGEPQVFLYDLENNSKERLGNFPGMSFAPRYSPDGESVVMSLSRGGNTDIYTMDLKSRNLRRLTQHPGIETAPSFSPDGKRIVFESDRSGKQQLYVMPSFGGAPTRISFTPRGTYGTPVWSPQGDLIAFTKILDGVFHIGVMRPDGGGERLLSRSFLEEGPSFAPNGRVLIFYREERGRNGKPQLVSVDVTGRNLRRVRTPEAASDPAWSPLRK